MSIGTFWGKTLHLNFFCPSLKLSKKSWAFRVRKHILEGNSFLRQNFLLFYHFWTLTKQFLACWQEFFNWVEGTAFYVSVKKVLRKKNKTYDFPVIFGPEQSFSVFVKNIFGRMVKTSFYEATGTYWGKIYSEPFLLVPYFSDIQQKVWPSGKLF